MCFETVAASHTVWLTPQKLPFMGGTYFPPDRFVNLLKKMKSEGGDQEGVVMGPRGSIM